MNRLVYIAAVTLVLVGAGTAASGQQFRKAVYYGTGKNTGPYAVVSAHLTNSGHLDLAFADYASDSVSILLGNGDGTFQSPIKFSVPAAFALAVGDFNDDGNADLAVVESAGNQFGFLQILIGEGNGRFQKGELYQLGIEPTSVAIADFNGDGHLDLAVANNGGQSGKGSVMVFAGTGKGTFKTPVTYEIAGAPWGIAARDLNGDHSPDLAVTNLGGYVSILLNDGTGHFLKPVSYRWNGAPVDVKIVDLRHDGRQDLVVADLAEGMVVLLNNGNGTFGKPTIYIVCGNHCQPPEACVLADFNLDGKLDVACAASLYDSYLFYGNGRGQFGAANPIHDTIQNQGGYGIASGDFNHDGVPDLAFPIELKGKVAILLNTK
ncbi:MAG: VCBS repeat-containing protein [Terriglobales bacterium]